MIRYPSIFFVNPDKTKIVIPYSVRRERYITEGFKPELVDNNCTLEDITMIIHDIVTSTKNLKIYRRLCSNLHRYVFFVLFILFLVMLILGFAFRIGPLAYVGCALDGLLIILFIAYHHWRQTAYAFKLPKLYRTISAVLDRHKEYFEEKGLHWDVPLSCAWLELWLDYKYENFIPGARRSTRLNTNSTVEKAVQIHQVLYG